MIQVLNRTLSSPDNSPSVAREKKVCFESSVVRESKTDTFNKKNNLGSLGWWWFTPLTPALGKQRKADL